MTLPVNSGKPAVFLFSAVMIIRKDRKLKAVLSVVPGIEYEHPPVFSQVNSCQDCVGFLLYRNFI